MVESFKIQSDISKMTLVEDRVFDFCTKYNVGNFYSTISVAVSQAVNNAIVHGNHQNPELNVTITLGTCRGGLFVEVADEGCGFDFGSYGSLPAGEGEHGVGIFVMNQLADEVTYSDGGRRVRLEFEVNGIDPADSLQRRAVLHEYFSPVLA